MAATEKLSAVLQLFLSLLQLPIASAELTTKYNSQVISLLHRSAFQSKP